MIPKYEISFAAHTDVPRLIEIATKYANDYGEQYDPIYLNCHFHDIISDQNSVILTSVEAKPQLIITGFIAITLVMYPTSNEKQAYKLHWIVDKDFPSRGTALLKAGEHWAKLHGAKKYVVSIRDKAAELLMSRQKFNLKSFNYEKSL